MVIRSLPVVVCIALALSATSLEAQNSSIERWRTLGPREEAMALGLARRAFDAYVTRRETIAPPNPLPPLFQQRVGVFVSTMRHGAPRCCMGTVYPIQSNAAREIIENAVAAGGRDRRFAPVQPRELRALTLILSVVDRPVPIAEADLATLDPVREGLMVRYGDRCGVVLSGETTRVERMLAWARIRPARARGSR